MGRILFVNQFTKFSYYNIGQIRSWKKLQKHWSCNIGLYQWPGNWYKKPHLQ